MKAEDAKFVVEYGAAKGIKLHVCASDKGDYGVMRMSISIEKPYDDAYWRRLASFKSINSNLYYRRNVEFYTYHLKTALEYIMYKGELK